MQKIDAFILKDIISHVEVASADFDTNTVYRLCVWSTQLSGESMLFVGLVRACNFID